MKSQMLSYRTWVILRIALIISTVLLAAGTAAATDADRLYGAEGNPTGNPIGGGDGYTRTVAKGTIEVSSAEELSQALREAKSGDVVYVSSGSQIDLTGYVGLIVRSGVTLAGDRGVAGNPGPLLFTSQYNTTPLFVLLEGSRITGLRIQGPDPDVETNHPTSMGISAAGDGSEVDNSEIFNWSYAGVAVAEGAAKVYIHHNYIHHVQRSGLGYPVVVNSGTALIEANIFDWYRHAIAGTGFKGVGYEARYNLVLEHATSTAFDMHGGSDFCAGRSTPCKEADLEMAGEYVIIHHNTFVVSSRRAIGIRGVPRQRLEVYNNWFYNPTSMQGFIYAYFEGGNSSVHNNVYGQEQRLEEVGVTPEPFIRRCGYLCTGRNPIVDVAPGVPGVLFRFLSPVVQSTPYSGELPIRAEAQFGDVLSVRQVEILLDGQLIYTGGKAPGQNELVLDTVSLEDGSHELRMLAYHNQGGALKRTIAFRTSNWWKKEDELRPPVTSGWFGTVDQSLTSAKSAGWLYDTSNPDAFAGDEERMRRGGVGTEYLEWKTPMLKSFSVTLYGRHPQVDSVRLMTSSDGAAWKNTTYSTAAVEPAVDGWYQLQLAGELGDVEANFFRLEASGEEPEVLQIGKVVFRGRK